MMMYDDLVKLLRETTKEQNGEKTLWWQAADAIEELIKDRDIYIKAMTDEHNRAATLAWKYRWIPVTERLPEEEGEVLCINDYHYYLVGWLYYSENSEDYICESDGEVLLGVTHWMPCPKPPESERE